MYPVMLNIDGRKCVVVGGGSVALRKAKKIAECGGSVTVISPEFTDGFDNFDTIKKAYEKCDLEGAFLVTAATDDKTLNRRITADAKNMKILSYAVDDADASDFILPASKNDGDITVAASTSGKYPFLAKRIRDEISNDIEFYNSLIPYLEAVRAEILASDRENKKELLQALVSDEMIDTARKDIESYREAITEIIK